MPPLLSLNPVPGNRSCEPPRSVRSVNRSVVPNRESELSEPPEPPEPPDESPNLSVELLWLIAGQGQREAPSDPPDIEPARESKLPPALRPDAPPALSSKLSPTELAPQVPDPPASSETLPTADPMLVPIELAPLEVAAVVVAYSPIVCAFACVANIATAAVSIAGPISLTSLIKCDLP